MIVLLLLLHTNVVCFVLVRSLRVYVCVYVCMYVCMFVFSFFL